MNIELLPLCIGFSCWSLESFYNMSLSREAYVKKTKELIEKERQTELDETRLLQENVPAKELERRGVALIKLNIASTHTGLYGRTVVVFEPQLPRKELPSHSFTPGDIAGLSLSKSDDGNEVLGSGIVSRVTSNSVSVAFDESYETSNLEGQLYKLVKLANDVTYRRLKRALGDLDAYRGGRSGQLIDVLFGETELGPAFSTARDGKDTFDKDKISFLNTKLDASQQAAVQFALSQRELAIIHGPPGTGKTTTVVEIILQAVKQGLKILACAPSNVAVDNLLERLAAYKTRVIRLGHPARLLDSIQKLSLDAIMRHSEEAEVTKGIREDINDAMSQLKKAKDGKEKRAIRTSLQVLRKDLRKQEAVTMQEVLKRASVVGATLTSATDDSPLKHLDKEHFDLVIIDECSQAVEAACWIPLLRGPRVILAGDHHQLPPTIISHEAAKEGLALTLMERQLALHGEKAMRMLTVQYRMNQHIMTWASNELYEGKLTAHSSVATHLLRDLPSVAETEDTSTALLLVDTAGCSLWELDVPDEVSKGNEGEVDLCVVHVEKLVKAGLDPSDIAVIAPYNLQVELLRLRLSQKYPKLEIKSVDGFQGREKEAVIISMVRSNDKREVGFLAENRRINVAITRARRHLAVVCDSETIGAHKFLQRLVDYMSEHGEVRSAEQYIQEGEIDPTAKRPEFLQDKIDDAASKAKHPAPAQKVPKKKNKPAEKSKQPSLKQPTERKANATERTPVEVEAEEQRLTKILVDFFANDKVMEYAFPPTLESWQRFQVHSLAEKLGLQHVSIGENEERHIVVSKVNANKGKRNVTKGNEDSPKSAGSAIKERETATKGTESISKGKANNKKTENQQSSAKSFRTEHSLVDVKSSKENKEESGSVSSLEISAKKDYTTCNNCHKDIPNSNWTLHELRCVPLKAAEATSARHKEVENIRPPSSGKQKKKNKKQKQAAAAAPEEDFDALIEAAKKENTRCHVDKCKENAATLGQNCCFCAHRFCIKHHMAEVHGCGAAAKSQARQMISREGVLYRGSGIPDKKPDPVKRAHLQRKLDKKLDKLGSERKAKTKD